MPETGPLTEATVLPVAAERAVWALAELVAGCPANQEAVRELHGIAPLVWLLDGPADSMITIGEQLPKQRRKDCLTDRGRLRECC